MSNAGDRERGRGQPSEASHLGDELLSRLVDGDLAPDERRRAETHLATCVDCRHNQDALRSTVTLLRALPSPRPARSFQLAPSYAPQPSRWRRLPGWLTTEMPALRAAAVAIVLLIGGIAAFGALRDDDQLSNDGATDVAFEATVATSDGVPTPVATIVSPPLDQAQATTPSPTSTGDTSASRSAPDAEAAEIATSTPTPTDEVSEEVPPPLSAAPDPAVTATSAPATTPTPERETIFGIEEESGDAEEGSDTSASDADLPEAAVTEEGDAEQQAADESRPESSAQSGSTDAEADDDDLEEAGDAPGDAAAEESEPARSAAYAKATPTATPLPRATWQPTNLPATPVGSPHASPLASPVASPVATPVDTSANQSVPIDDRLVGASMPSRRVSAMLALTIVVMLAGIGMAARATRRTFG